MAKIYIGDSKVKLYLGSSKIRRVYKGAEKVYSSGNIVTYNVDNGVSYTEEVEEGTSCLSPKTFTPSKSGWSFVGWREDTGATNSVLSSKVMGEAPISLYAVFSAPVTVTYYDDSKTASTSTKDRIYNNTNVVNPSFKLNQKSKSGWSARGWSTANTANGAISYNDAVSFTRDSNVTLYGMYQKDITVTYYNNSTSASATSGVRYYNSNGTVINPSFTLVQANKTGWDIRGWSTGTSGNSAVSYNSGVTFSRDSSVTLYSTYSKSCTTTCISYNSTQYASGTAYCNYAGTVVNAVATLPSGAGMSGWNWRGWSGAGSTGASAGVVYANGGSIDMGYGNHTLYGLYEQGVTVTYYNNSTSASTAHGTRYYNAAGSTSNPSFTLTQTNKSGWTARGWSTGTSGNSGVTYNNGTTFTRDSSITLYGTYQKTCTTTCVSYGSTQYANGTAYCNYAGVVVDATASAPSGASMSGWTWRGWSIGGATGATVGVGFANGDTINMGSSDHTIYGLYQQGITCSFVSNGTQYANGTRYYNASGDTTNASITVPNGVAISGWSWRGWSAASTGTGNASVAYANGTTISGLTTGYTYYGLYETTITVSYNANGGSGSTSAQTGTRYYNAAGNYVNPSFALRSNGFTPSSGTAFSAWAIGSASGTTYAPGASITLSSNTTFYAIWYATDLVITPTNASVSNNDIWASDSYMHAIASDVDTSKYKGIQVTFSSASALASHTWRKSNVILRGGNAETLVVSHYNQGEDEPTATTSGTFTLNFSQSSGTTTVYAGISSGGSYPSAEVVSYSYNISSAKLLGR